MTVRDHHVSAVCCSLPANGHTSIYVGRCKLLTTIELQLLAAHLTTRNLDRVSNAYVYPLGREVNDTTVRQLEPSDHLAVVWRHCRPVTFFFTRTNQLTLEHMRVNSIRVSEFNLDGERT